MNEQQIEAVERLVESGIFPNGLIAITLGLDEVRGRAFLPEGPNALLDFWENMLEKSRGEDDGDEWKRAGVS